MTPRVTIYRGAGSLPRSAADLHVVSHFVNSIEMSAVRAAKELSVVVDSVPYDSTSTMQARRGKGLNGTFEAVEYIASSLHNDV